MYTLEELDTLEKHLDDESEWDNINSFWEVWGPRVSSRILKLIQTARANLNTTDLRNTEYPIFNIEGKDYQMQFNTKTGKMELIKRDS